MPLNFNQTNFIGTVNQQGPVLVRPKPVFAPTIFTKEQEAFLRNYSAQLKAEKIASLAQKTAGYMPANYQN